MALRFFIKISVSAVCVHSWQGRLFVCVSKFGRVRSRCQAVAVAPDQHRSRNTLAPKNTKQGRFCVAQKSGRVSAAFAFVSFVNGVAPVGRVTSNFGRESPFVHTKILETTSKKRRAHLHIAPQCRAEKPCESCGIAGLLDAQKRRVP